MRRNGMAIRRLSAFEGRRHFDNVAIAAVKKVDGFRLRRRDAR